MDAMQRRKYRKEAAAWAAEGRRAMSIDPAHLLILLDEYRPPPSPTEMQRLLDQTRRELKETQSKLRVESDRANAAYAQGHAAAVLEQAETVRRLRADLSLAQTRAQSAV